MLRVSVVSTKETGKIIIKFISVVLILFIFVQIGKYSKKYLGKVEVNTNECIAYISEEIISMGNIKYNNTFEMIPEKILNKELSISQNYNQVEINDVNSNNKLETQEEITQTNANTIEDVSTEVKTEVINSGVKETFNYQLNGVKIKNETDYNLDNYKLNTDIKVDNKNIIIFHTHTCESYTATEQNKYISTGNYRTTDLNYTVAKVGDVLQEQLSNYGFNVIHNKTYHDYPAYTGSYGRSLNTVKDILDKNAKADIIIDLHRDAIGDDLYAPKVKIGDEYAAQIMFVIGTNGSGLAHENWQQNLEFAIKVQEKANEMYPGLFKPMILRDARYNQHLGSCATIMEFGATGNTLEECEVSAKYLAKVLDAIVE